MLEWWRIVVNAVALVGCFYCMWWIWRLYRLCRGGWLLPMLGAFVLVAIPRVGVILGSAFFMQNSRVVTSGTFVLFALAFHLLYRTLVEWFKNGNGKEGP